MRRIIAVALLCFLICACSNASAQPSDLTLSFDSKAKTLTIVIKRPQGTPNFYYREFVEVFLNGKKVAEDGIMRAWDVTQKVARYPVPDAKEGDVLAVEVSHVVKGVHLARIKKEIKI